MVVQESQRWYPQPDISNFSDLLGYANSVARSSLFVVIIAGFWLILFSNWKDRYDAKIAFTGATACSFMIAIPLTLLKYQDVPILNPYALLVMIILTALGAMILYKSQ